MRHIRMLKAVPSLALGTVVLFAGCLHRNPGAPPAEVTITPIQDPAPPASGGAGVAIPTAPSMVVGDPVEPYVDLELADAPVKLILQRLADIGGLQLIIPSNLNKTLSVQYVHVPVSVALNDVLRRSGLRLGAGPAARLPFDTVTVFYQLPANVDSMSVDAIVKRFGVSREMAELIVKSRRP